MKKTAAGRSKGTTGKDNALERDGVVIVDGEESSAKESSSEDEDEVDAKAELGECI